ncbi:MAG: HD domain-containing protein [bacterium]
MKEIRAAALGRMSGGRASHGWDHVERVWSLCRTIGREEGADLEILELAAFLHDLGRAEETASAGKTCHAQAGAMLALEILREQGFPDETIRAVVHCIESHRFRAKGSRPRSLEARVLFDADKLDSIGAVGVGRAFQFAGEVGAVLHNPHADISETRPYSPDDTAYREFCVKLVRIRDSMLTATGRRLAADRHRFMVAFFDRLQEEVAGRR